MTAVSLFLAIAAFACFGAASDGWWYRATGRSIGKGARRRCRWGAWAALAAAFPPAVAAQGWILGPVLWSGLVMAAAGVVFLFLNLVVQPAAATRGDRRR